MPFDSLPTLDDAARLPGFGATAPGFTTNPRATVAFRVRPVPPWRLNQQRVDSIGNTLTVLLRARELIADERRWCRRTFARGWRGIPVPLQSRAAHRFCALGAIMRAAGELRLPVEDARNTLEWQTVRPIQDWNDDPTRTHGDVLAAFDAAVASLEAA